MRKYIKMYCLCMCEHNIYRYKFHIIQWSEVKLYIMIYQYLINEIHRKVFAVNIIKHMFQSSITKLHSWPPTSSHSTVKQRTSQRLMLRTYNEYQRPILIVCCGRTCVPRQTSFALTSLHHLCDVAHSLHWCRLLW